MSQSESNRTPNEPPLAISAERPSTFLDLCRSRMAVLVEWQAQNDVSLREFAMILEVAPSTLRRWLKDTPRINEEKTRNGI
jgi:hypothetical protein